MTRAADNPSKTSGSALQSPPIGAELLGWFPIFGMVLIAANDYIRQRNPSWITGKISDVAVLLYFPFLLSTGFALLLWGIDRVRRRLNRRAKPLQLGLTRRRLIAVLVLSGAGLSAVNLSYTLRDLYLELLRAVDVFGLFGHFVYTTDPTDLIALPTLYLSWLWGNRFVVDKQDSGVKTTPSSGG